MGNDVKSYKVKLQKEIDRLIEGSDFNVEYWRGYRTALIDLKEDLDLSEE